MLYFSTCSLCHNDIIILNHYSKANSANCSQFHNDAVDDAKIKNKKFSGLLNLSDEITGSLHYEIYRDTYISLFAHSKPTSWNPERITVFNQYTTNCSNYSLKTLCDYGSSECYSPNKICMFERDIYGDPVHCSDTEHLRYCALHECANAFKCHGSYCIPIHMVCDMIVDCPDGEDENNCDILVTQGMFR